MSTAQAVLEYISAASKDEQFLSELVLLQNKFLSRNFANPGRAADAALDIIEEILKSPNAPFSVMPEMKIALPG